MGTNYYVVPNRPSTREPVHIGKSSAGWLFCFQYQNEAWYDPPIIWRDYDEVKAFLKKYTVDNNVYVIMDEYDTVVPYDEFIELVERKQNDKRCQNNPENFRYDVDNIDGYRFTRKEFC